MAHYKSYCVRVKSESMLTHRASYSDTKKSTTTDVTNPRGLVAH